MDAATTSSRDARRCARPGCADIAVATLAFRYDRQQAWLTTLADEKSPATYDLCGPCSDRTAPPRGWELVDERPDLDGLADPVEERDAVRDAIAAALRGGEPAPAHRALSVVPDPPAPPAMPDASPPVGEIPPDADRPDPVAEPAATATPPATPEPALTPSSVAQRADHPRPRRRRRRPVEVLIEGPEASPESSSTSRTWRVTTSHRPGSHAPTSHRLSSVVVSRTEPASTAVAPDQQPEPEPGPGTPPEPLSRHDDGAPPEADRRPRRSASEPAGGGGALAEPPVPSVAPAPPAPPVPAVATAVDVPLAFDTVPDRLVQVEPQRTSPRG